MRNAARYSTLALLAGSILAPASLADGFRIVISTGAPVGYPGAVYASGCGPRDTPAPRHNAPRYDSRPGGWSWGVEHRQRESYEQRLCRAWDLLAGECAYEAQRLFADLTRERCEDAAPWFGLSLSFAVLEDHASAVRAMRTAFELAPRGFCLPDVRDLDDVVECVADRYDDIADHYRRDPDAHFMLAAAHYLDGRELKARRAIEDAIELGDCSRAAETLACLVEAHPRRHYSRR